MMLRIAAGNFVVCVDVIMSNDGYTNVRNTSVLLHMRYFLLIRLLVNGRLKIEHTNEYLTNIALSS